MTTLNREQLVNILYNSVCLSVYTKIYVCLTLSFSLFLSLSLSVCVTVLAWQVVKPRSRFTSLSLLGKECSIGRSSSSASFRRRRYRCSHDCVCFHVGSQLAWQFSVWQNQETRELISARKTSHKRNNKDPNRLRYLSPGQCRVHKLHQKFILCYTIW